MKKLIIGVYFIGLIVGCVYVNFTASFDEASWGMFNYSTIEMLKDVEINLCDLFFYVFRSRMLEIGMLILIMLLQYKGVLYGIGIGLFGANIGMAMSACVLNMGFKGLWVFVVSVFPHYVFYVLVLVVAFEICCERKKHKGDAYMVAAVKIFALTLIGVLMECFVSTAFLEKLC